MDVIIRSLQNTLKVLQLHTKNRLNEELIIHAKEFVDVLKIEKFEHVHRVSNNNNSSNSNNNHNNHNSNNNNNGGGGGDKFKPKFCKKFWTERRLIR